MTNFGSLYDKNCHCPSRCRRNCSASFAVVIRKYIINLLHNKLGTEIAIKSGQRLQFMKTKKWQEGEGR